MDRKQFDPKAAQEFVNQKWDESMKQSLEDFIAIPNMSQNFDPEWDTNGLLQKAADHVMDWSKAQNVEGLKIEQIKHEGKSPLIFMEHPGNRDDNFTILFYGHYDKQPPFTGWSEGLDPYKAVIRDGKMYGRGGADDGYSIYGSVTALKACQEQGLPHPRVVCLFEGDEESGSSHLIYYINQLKDKIKEVDLVYCLDSGALNYEQLWMTTSLRGVLLFTLNVEVLSEGVHSGDASGIVPDSFRIARQLLNRIEDPQTGRVAPEFTVNVPGVRYTEAQDAYSKQPKGVERFPMVEGMVNVENGNNNFQCLLNNTWLPQVSVIGADGLPPCQTAGNVLRPKTSLRISMRIPPTLDSEKAKEDMIKILEADQPYGCKVTVTNMIGQPGWSAPYISDELSKSFNEASEQFFGQPAIKFGMGGSIPLMGILNNLFPSAQFVISGILGPGNNAHGPNEMFVIDYLLKFIPCMGKMLADAQYFQKRR